MIVKIDSKNMHDDINDFYKQCICETKVKITTPINKIIIAGMGGSAIGGDLLGSLLHQIPVMTVKDYHIPKYVDKNCLIFISSFSGNTEETLSMFKEALNKKAKIVALSTGGKVKEIAEKNKIPFVQLNPENENIQPRAALGYSFFSMLKVLENSGFVKETVKDLQETIKILKNNKDIKEQAQEMAYDIKGKIPLVYASERFKTAAERLKTQFNENSKIMAFYNMFSEMNHNEIMGFENVNPKLHVIILRDNKDNKRIIKRMDVCRPLMGKIGIEEVYARGRSEMAKYFSLIHFGDWVTYYLALINKVDPTEISLINKLKKKLE